MKLWILTLYPESAKGNDEIDALFIMEPKGKALKQDYQIYDPNSYRFVPVH
jgi:hypothetical protein